MTAVKLDDVSITPGSRAILDGIAFGVQSGESFGLVGESGSGKSTVLRCIAGLLSTWTGRIEVGGQSVREIPRKEFCRRCQMVFQDPYGSLHPRQSVQTALLEPIRIHRLDRASERIDKILIDVGLDPDFRYRYPHELSGGQRQRVAIARALVLEPSVLLLDEPTSALDVSVQAEILNLLSSLAQKSRLTYILVSHDLAVIDHMCDRIAVMQFGRIVETLDRRALSDGSAKDPYARELIKASLEYDRASLEDERPPMIDATDMEG
jgi:ABC-type dipeptide/oligopeptide/nickel transport system ATPase subunit